MTRYHDLLIFLLNMHVCFALATATLSLFTAYKINVFLASVINFGFFQLSQCQFATWHDLLLLLLILAINTFIYSIRVLKLSSLGLLFLQNILRLKCQILCMFWICCHFMFGCYCRWLVWFRRRFMYLFLLFWKKKCIKRVYVCFGLPLPGRFIKLTKRFYIQIVHRPLHIAFIFVYYIYIYVCMFVLYVWIWCTVGIVFVETNSLCYMFDVRFASPVRIFLFNNIPYYRSDINIFIFVYIVYKSSIHWTWNLLDVPSHNRNTTDS